MKQILNTIFLKDCIDSLDERYKSLINKDLTKYFSYANIFDLPLYYNLFTLKKNPDYNLYNKLHENKIIETIKLIVDKIKEENYDAELILFIYSYICNLSLNNSIDSYVKAQSKVSRFTSKKRKMHKYSKTTKYIEIQFYEDQYNEKISKFQINHYDITLGDKTFDLLKEITSKLHLFSLGINVIKIGLDNFKYYNKKYFKKCNLGIKLKTKSLDTVTKNKRYSASSFFIKKSPIKDYLNKGNEIWINENEETTDSFYDIYQKTIKKTTELLNLISEKIHYNSKNDKQIEQHIKSVLPK